MHLGQPRAVLTFYQLFSKSPCSLLRDAMKILELQYSQNLAYILFTTQSSLFYLLLPECHADCQVYMQERTTDQVGSAIIRENEDMTHAYL
jgi:hypothetical protein